MTTTQVDATRANGLNSLAFSRRVTTQLLDGVPADKRLHQPTAGANHAMWVAGHIAMADDFFLTKLAGAEKAIPESWAGLFWMGSEPTGDAAAYPSYDEVKAKFEERREALLDWYRNASDDQLAEPMPEDLASFAPTVGALMSSMAAHEAMHAGQLTVVRKSLGLPLIMG